MINSLLGFVAGSDGNYYFENFGEALIYALIGFLIVFAGIVIIILIIWLLGLILRKTNNLAFMRGWGAKIKEKRAKKKGEQPVAAEEVLDGGEEVPDEIKAAIIAAVTAYYFAEAPKCEFKVKRIKRI